MIDKSSSKWIAWNYEIKKRKITLTLEETLKLFQNGCSLQEIAKKRKYKLQTVEYQIIELITRGFISVYDVIDNSVIEIIENVIGNHVPETLSEIKHNVGDNISYFEIKCYLAHLTKDPI